MKISLLTDGITPFVVGGMQRHSCNMARSLADLGVEIDLYHVLPEGVGAEEVAATFSPSQWEEITSFDFSWPPRGRLPGHYVRESYQLSNEFLQQYESRPRPDVIYAKGLMAHAFLKAKQQKGIEFPPIITNAHGYEMYQRPADMIESLKRFVLRPGIRYVSQNSDFVASYGGGITDILMDQLHISRDRILEVPGAIDQSWLPTGRSPKPDGAIRYGFLGRYERRKGVKELAAAFSGLSGDNQLHMIGPIPDEKRSQFPASTVFRGLVKERDEICELLDMIDILVVPSWSEGMPNVIMEAMARHTAIIGTDVGAVRCLVGPDTGWLIPPGDSKALLDALRESSSISIEKLHKLQDRANQLIAQNFTWPTVAVQLHDALNSIVTGQPQAVGS
ncbi:glycosyltransferase family 4 protein [Rhodopirellula europaea]|uniref:Glycosyl transferase, group 1 domain protein n=1 Tax=Rhodopirellula europaea SH398 TaxID=1263868 RepID=M5SF11_9BACT|nr:glycosyltransferase family 4 protein [Rhodopirellula europaea]EMI24754.1 Glycosyl transferase, group 1 domain protein [Rhodopirellula europaea SH398]